MRYKKKIAIGAAALAAVLVAAGTFVVYHHGMRYKKKIAIGAAALAAVLVAAGTFAWFTTTE